MFKHLPPWVTAVVISIVTIAAIMIVGKAQPQGDGNSLTKAGTDAPEIAGKLADGTDFRLSNLRGKVVLINIWATWCGPCRMEIPDLIAVQKKYASRGFTVVGLSDDDKLETAAEFAKQNGMDYPILKIDNDTKQAFSIEAIPVSIIVDKQGKMVWARVGAISEGEVSAQIEKLL